MNVVKTSGIFVFSLLLSLSTCLAQDAEPNQTDDGAQVMKATSQLNILLKESEDSRIAFEKALQEIKGEAQQDAFYAKNYPPPERLYARFMALAEKHPQDAAAVEALIWIVTNASHEAKDVASQQKASDLLLSHHIASEKLPLVFEIVNEDFLQDVFKRSPHQRIRGQAGFALAEKQLSRIRTVTEWRAKYPDWKTRWKWLEQTHNAYLVTTEIAPLSEASEELLGNLVRDFADVPIDGRRNGTKVGELANAHLHEVRKLGIGNPAPELVSVDLNGNPVRLVDLRGRVVVLDVWATWCGPCIAMIPQHRQLTKKLRGKPFTLVSINADENRDDLTDFIKNNPMPWTHWYNGSDGNIIAELNVWSYPRVFVLDAKGIIRFKDLRGKLLDDAVETLLEELNAD